MPSFEEAKQLLGESAGKASAGISFDPKQIVGAIRGGPEFAEDGSLIKPNPVVAWIRNFFADIDDAVLGLVDPTDEQLYANSRFLLAITCAGLAVGTAHLYLVYRYASTNAALLSPDIVTGAQRTFFVGVGVSFFSILLWLYLLRKGRDGYSKDTLQFFAVFNFILVVAASGLSMLTTRVLSVVISSPSVLAQYDASVVLNIQRNFSRATTTFNWMILWCGGLLLYAVVGGMVAEYIKK